MVNLQAVRRELADTYRRAGRKPRATSQEWEAGLDDADVRGSIAIMRSDAKRLEALEAWFIKEGLTEAASIPAELTWEGWFKG